MDAPAAAPVVRPTPLDASEIAATQETLSLIRAQSGIRFLALPVVLTAFGLLVREYHDASSPVPARLLLCGGLLLALLGCVFEVVLSRNLIVWWQALRTRGLPEPWSMIFAHRHPGSLWAARLAMFAPHALELAYWVQAAPDFLDHAALDARPWPTEVRLLLAAAVLLVCFGIAVGVWARARPDDPIHPPP